MKKIISMLVLLLVFTAGAFAQSDTTVLKGTASDPDGDALTYAWSEVSGPTCTIVSPTALTTTVKGLLVGVYVFQLKVTDVWGASASSTVKVSVNQNHAPISNAGPDQFIRLAGVALNYSTPKNLMVKTKPLNSNETKIKNQLVLLENYLNKSEKENIDLYYGISSTNE